MRHHVYIAVFFLTLVGCAHQPLAPQKLLGVWHQVKPGDSVSLLAKRYGANSSALRELNDLPENGSLAGRVEVFVPKKSGTPPGTGASPSRRYAHQNKRNDRPEKGCKANGHPCIAWPVIGPVISTFGPRANGQHDGIDIAAKRGALVKAALDGTVLYSGNEIAGYGNMIVIRHSDNILTVYAHNDENLVKEGNRVARGQTVARVGNSGNSKKVQLHFEVRANEKPVNPLLYLPKKGE